MLRIKAKPGFNLIFKDPNVPNLKSTDTNWSYIENEIFENSTEIQKALNFLIVEKVEEKVEEAMPVKDNNIIEKGEGIFVHNGHGEISEPDQEKTFVIKAPEEIQEVIEIFEEPKIEVKKAGRKKVEKTEKRDKKI